MRKLLLVLLLFASPVWAAQITIDVPDAVASNAGDICEQLRQDMRVRASTWSLKVCTEELVRVGLRTTYRRQIQNAGQAQIASDVSAAVVQFDGVFPAYDPRTGRENPPMRMTCGDGVLDNDPTIPYVEECDDGNTTPGDGCSEQCVIE